MQALLPVGHVSGTPPFRRCGARQIDSAAGPSALNASPPVITAMHIKVACLCLLPQPSAPWRRVISDDQAVYSVLDARTDRGGGEVRVWERVDFRETEEGRQHWNEVTRGLEEIGVEGAGGLYRIQARHVYRCEEGLAAFEQLIYYDREGKVIAEASDRALGGWVSPARGSAAEALMLDACQRPADPQ